jgi:hypothetical protein
MAKVTVFSTKGQKQTIVETTATTWGELKKDLDIKGIQYDGMQAVVRETKGILKLDGAVLPKGLTVGDGVTDDFVLFLSPSKQTAGSINPDDMGYAELKTYIKEQRENSDEAKDFFGDYTHSTSVDLREMIQDWLDSQPEEEVEVNDSVVNKVFNLLNEAVELMATIPGVKNNSQFDKLKEEAIALEFELQNS